MNQQEHDPVRLNRFLRRKSSKSRIERSNRSNTKRTREYEQSRVGLDAALLKIKRNRRVAICRKRAELKKQPGWTKLSADEKQQRTESALDEIRLRYDIAEEEAMAEWRTIEMEIDSNSENAEVEDVDFDSEKASRGSDSAAEQDLESPDFETDDDGVDDINLSPKSRTKFFEQLVGTLHEVDQDMRMIGRQLKVTGSWDEEPAEFSDD